MEYAGEVSGRLDLRDGRDGAQDSNHRRLKHDHTSSTRYGLTATRPDLRREGDAPRLREKGEDPTLPNNQLDAWRTGCLQTSGLLPFYHVGTSPRIEEDLSAAQDCQLSFTDVLGYSWKQRTDGSFTISGEMPLCLC